MGYIHHISLMPDQHCHRILERQRSFRGTAFLPNTSVSSAFVFNALISCGDLVRQPNISSVFLNTQICLLQMNMYVNAQNTPTLPFSIEARLFILHLPNHQSPVKAPTNHPLFPRSIIQCLYPPGPDTSNFAADIMAPLEDGNNLPRLRLHPS